MIITKFNLVQHKSSVANPDYFMLLLKDGMILIRISWGQSYKKGDTDPGAFYVNPQETKRCWSRLFYTVSQIQLETDPDHLIQILKFWMILL